MATGFDFEGFKKSTEFVALLVSGEDVFSLLNRQVTVPASCAALAWGGDPQPTLVDAGQSLTAKAVEEFLLVRTSPIFIDYDVDHIFSQDGYEFHADLRISVAVVKDRAELVAFRNAVIGSSNRATIDDMKRHCAEAVQSALSAFAGMQTAAALALPSTWESFDGFFGRAVQACWV